MIRAHSHPRAVRRALVGAGKVGFRRITVGALSVALAVSTCARAADAGGAAPAVVAGPSTDVATPGRLRSKTLTGKGTKTTVSYYYALATTGGMVTLTASGRNRSSAFTSALGVRLLSSTATALCDVDLGNNTRTATKRKECTIVAAQPLVLRVDLSAETIDYKVVLDGSIKLLSGSEPVSKPAVPANAAIGSTDIAAPTPLVGSSVRGAGSGQATTLYYAFTAGPGALTLTGDGKNRPSAFTNALKLTLQDASTRSLCTLSLGNVTRDERKVVSCTNPSQQGLVLRVDLAPETIDWRATVDGPALHGLTKQ